MIEYLKSLFRKLSPESLALRELEEARRSLLEAQTGREYADSMVKYHEARIRRLTKYLEERHTIPEPTGEI